MELHVHAWGPPDGEPLVCLHGVTGHGERFKRLAEERWTGRRVLAPDLRGHGRSGWEAPLLGLKPDWHSWPSVNPSLSRSPSVALATMGFRPHSMRSQASGRPSLSSSVSMQLATLSSSECTSGMPGHWSRLSGTPSPSESIGRGQPTLSTGVPAGVPGH